MHAFLSGMSAITTTVARAGHARLPERHERDHHHGRAVQVMHGFPNVLSDA
jgi:hypothetical protein